MSDMPERVYIKPNPAFERGVFICHTSPSSEGWEYVRADLVPTSDSIIAIAEWNASKTQTPEPSLSVRDQVALAILQGFCSDPNISSEMDSLLTSAFGSADAFLAYRKGEG
jgi:hypothetical protein